MLVTGSRHATEAHRLTVWARLDEWAARFGVTSGVLVHGKCRFGGADLIAHAWAQERGWLPEPHPEGEFGGPLPRNTGMVNLGARACIAFPSMARPGGTLDCLTKAIRAGIEVHVYPLDIPAANR
jgi:hypothetical protein